MLYFLRKIAFFLLTVWAAVTLNFFIPRIQGGDPAEAIVQRLTGQSQAVDPAQVEAVRNMLGAPDIPLLEQYVNYLQNVVQGQYGVSYSYFPYSVTHMISDTLPWTLVLLGVTHIYSFVVGTAIGAWAAWKRNGIFDSWVTTFSNFFGSLPYFWIALLLLYFFAFENRWFPDAGGYSGRTEPGWNWPFLKDAARHAALPAISLAITGPIGWIMGMRNNMVQVLGDDYTRLAVAKGLSQPRIAFMYGARNAILPNFTGFAVSLGGLVGGSILVEQIFNYPGMGRLMFESIGNRDYPLMQTIFLLTTIGVLTANFLADMLYGVLDPRVRRGGGTS
jgi:peptide/nickel transport system permease protein